MPRFVSFITLGAALQLSAAFPSRADDSPIPNADYGVSILWPLGGTGGWEALAVEPSGARLFVSRGDRVDVIETAGGRRATTMPNAAAVRGIAFAADFRRAYLANSHTNTVTAVELDTLRPVQESPVVGKRLEALLYDSSSQHLIAADVGGNAVSVLDPNSLQLIASIPLPGTPQALAADGAGSLYVETDGEPGKLVAVDAKTLKIKATWNLAGCADPSGLAVDASRHRLFSTCSNEVLAVTDAVSGKQVARVAIGAGADGVAYDPDLRFAFSANGADGTLTVIRQESPDAYRVIATVQTQPYARRLALDPATHRLYLPSGRVGPTPAPTAEQPHPRPSIDPSSFVILVAEPK